MHYERGKSGPFLDGASRATSLLSPASGRRVTSFGLPMSHARLVAALNRDLHQGGVQALVDKKVHPAAYTAGLVRPANGSRFNGTRLVLFIVRPRSLSDFGRPRRGWAATQIRARSNSRSVSLG